MLNSDFHNGEKVDLHSAFSVFIIMMGFLFYLDASQGTHSAVALTMSLLGFAWYKGHDIYVGWKKTHTRR